jgi:hypothetical protein
MEDHNRRVKHYEKEISEHSAELSASCPIRKHQGVRDCRMAEVLQNVLQVQTGLRVSDIFSGEGT